LHAIDQIEAGERIDGDRGDLPLDAAQGGNEDHGGDGAQGDEQAKAEGEAMGNSQVFDHKLDGVIPMRGFIGSPADGLIHKKLTIYRVTPNTGDKNG
jgi:hypothetical protein